MQNQAQSINWHSAIDWSMWAIDVLTTPDLNKHAQALPQMQ